MWYKAYEQTSAHTHSEYNKSKMCICAIGNR